MTARATRVKSPLPAQRRRRQSIAPRHRTAFLEALSAGWAVRHAAKRSTVDFRRWYELRDRDESFEQEWRDAFEQGTQALEDEARRRAVDGYDEDTYDGQGDLLRRVHRYDGALLQTLLKGRRPEVYRDNAPPAVAPVIILQSLLAQARGETIDGEAIEVAGELEAATS